MFELLFGFTLILTRISAFFLILPVFGWQAVPLRIKVAVTVLLSVFFTFITPLGIDPTNVSTVQAVLLLAGEATYGLAMGLIVVLLFSVVIVAGRIVERQMGLAMAAVLDPLTGERSRPLASLLEMIFVLIFLSANGHHLFLLILSKSLGAFPPGTVPAIGVLTDGVVRAGSAMFIASLRLAAPMLAAFLILMVALALLARLVPEMNILFISMPMRLGLGLMMAATFMPFVNGYVTEFANWMAKLLPI
ncbi:MAG: flagellar biosynthetic protein FliR [Sedimentisphaerales bacterium]|nr:flagellar biosynthetic protein FliR [Sedimentisphaerales bacterium]